MHARVFLVQPVSRDPKFCVLMHRTGSNLHFQGLTSGADHCCVQRLIHIALGVGNVVVELTGDMRQKCVNEAKRRIAVRHRIDQNAYRANIVKLAELKVLALHFSIDAVDVLRPAGNLTAESVVFELTLNQFDNRIDVGFPARTTLIKLSGELSIGLGLQVPEHQILHFPLELPDTKPACRRGVDAQHLFGDSTLS